jgi:hypothetical protein
MPCRQGLDLRPLVKAATVQQDDHVAAEVPQQGTEKDGHLDRADVLGGMQVQIQSNPTALGAEGHRRDGRHLIALVPVPDNRGLTSRRPGPPHVRNQQEAALVGERQVGLQALGVFFTVGQRYRFQCAIAGSSRSVARRSGFWHDQFRALSTRLTWARCSRTPNARWITVAIRWVVHSSVANPHAAGPRSKRRGSFARCWAVNFGGRPGAGLAFNAVRPRRCTASRHKMTEL